MVIWITGISGAGKTTIANFLIKKYKKVIPNLINIDGDAIRKLYSDDLGYEEKDRIVQIKRLQKLCLFLETILPLLFFIKSFLVKPLGVFLRVPCHTFA